MEHEQRHPITETSTTRRTKLRRLSLCILLVAIHSVLLGGFIFFYTEPFYIFFFGVAVENFFFVQQAGLFLFCIGLFYFVPIKEPETRHRTLDIIILTKILAVLFLVSNAHLVAQPGAIFLAAAGDALMAIMLIHYSFAAGLLLLKKKSKAADMSKHQFDQD